MSLQTPLKVQMLQEALHAKAKGEPNCRFYTLYDKVYREDVLAYAYRMCRSNGGAPGVDGQSFEDIRAYGEERWLSELAEGLKEKTYEPKAVKRVWIPKSDGKQRPLGIPTIQDRVVQTATLVVIGPIFEADLQAEQYAYRPGRGAQDAVREVHRLVNTGHTEVVDADLSGYFDSIPHEAILKSVARRVSDKAILHLIKMWLIAPVEGTDERGNWNRTTKNRDEKRGTPQGSPISPLLANIYMRRFILGWKELGCERTLHAHIVNYADDFVICCRGTAAIADRAMRNIMRRIGLTVNEQKTQICNLPDAPVKFLGYTIGRCYSTRTGKAYLGTTPSKERVQSLIREIHDETTSGTTWMTAEVQVAHLNRKLRGWANYFSLGPVSKAYRAIDSYVTHRLRWWLRRKHKKAKRRATRFPNEYLYQTLGLVCLPELTASFPWAKA